MKTCYTVERDIDYELEAIELVYRIVNGKSYEQLKQDMVKRIQPAACMKIVQMIDKL